MIGDRGVLSSRCGVWAQVLALWAALVCGVLAVGGCGSTYTKLPSEHDREPTASLMVAYDRLVFRTSYHETTRAGEPTIKVAIHELGSGDSPMKVVFIHGVFTDSSAWRYLLPGVMDMGDLWLIDSPGCGESDAPDPESLGEDGYGPAAMAERITQALADRFSSEPPSTRLVLVAHSLGGAIAIRMLGDPALRRRYGQMLDRIESAVLISPLNVAQHKADADIIRLATVGGFRVGAGNALGLVMEKCAKSTVHSVGDPRYAVREEADKRYEILINASRRRAMQAQLLQAIAFDEDFLPRWEEMDRQVSIYPNVTLPTLILWGMRDEVLPVSTGYMLKDILPSASLVVVPGAKHSPQFERPRWTSEAIKAFVGGREIPAPPSPFVPPTRYLLSEGG